MRRSTSVFVCACMCLCVHVCVCCVCVCMCAYANVYVCLSWEGGQCSMTNLCIKQFEYEVYVTRVYLKKALQDPSVIII